MSISTVIVESSDTPPLKTPPRRRLRRTREVRRAAAAVLTGLGVFVGLQLAVSLVIEVWIPSVIDPSYRLRYDLVRQGRAADPEHTRTVVMLGSSLTAYGLDSQYLNKTLSQQFGQPVNVVNFGIPCSGPLSELLLWRRLRRDAVRPDLLLVEVHPLFLAEDFVATDVKEDHLPANRLSCLDLPVLDRYRAGTRPHLRRDVAVAALSPLYERRYALLHAIAPHLLLSANSQGLPLFYGVGAPDPPRMAPEARAALLDAVGPVVTAKLALLRPEGRGGDPLRELLADAHEAGVPTALVVMPESPTLQGWYPPQAWARLRSWLEQVRHENGAGIVVARQWLDEKDFQDAHHLLHDGAVRFSERLGREFITPWLRHPSCGESMDVVVGAYSLPTSVEATPMNATPSRSQSSGPAPSFDSALPQPQSHR